MCFWLSRHPRQYWICINWFFSPFTATLRQKLITVGHMRDICISSYVPLCFHSTVGCSLTGFKQISRALAPPRSPLLLSGCPIPLFITSLAALHNMAVAMATTLGDIIIITTVEIYVRMSFTMWADWNPPGNNKRNIYSCSGRPV